MTRDEIMQLDDDALRIAVARALGWTIWAENETVLIERAARGIGYADIILGMKPGSTIPTIPIPDYPRDIRAAYELEDALPVERRGAYAKTLFDEYEHDIVWNLIHASAADRCRAWLLTMDAKP